MTAAPGGQQSRLMSLIEAITNVVVGFLLALATQFAVFPLFGLVVSLSDNLLIGGAFTSVSLLRGFLLRRFFESGLMERVIAFSLEKIAKLDQTDGTS